MIRAFLTWLLAFPAVFATPTGPALYPSDDVPPDRLAFLASKRRRARQTKRGKRS